MRDLCYTRLCMKRAEALIIKKPGAKKPEIYVEGITHKLTENELVKIKNELREHVDGFLLRTCLSYALCSVFIDDEGVITASSPEEEDFSCVIQDCKRITQNEINEMVKMWLEMYVEKIKKSLEVNKGLETIVLVEGMNKSMPIVTNPLEESKFVSPETKQAVHKALANSYPFGGWAAWYLVKAYDDKAPEIELLGEYNSTRGTTELKVSVLKKLARYRNIMSDKIFRLYVNEALASGVMTLDLY